MLTAVYLQNRLPSRVIGKTPFELWSGSKPDLSHIKVFGSSAYVQIPASKRSKLDQKAVKLIFVGYSDEHKGYRFLDPETNRVAISRDARFMELDDGSEQVSPHDKEVIPEGSLNDIELTIRRDPEASGVLEDGEATEGGNTSHGDSVASGAPEDDESSDGWDTADNESEPPHEPELRREQRRTRGVLPSRLEDFVVGVAVETGMEPTDYREALRNEDWKQAMDAEMQLHAQNAMWTLAKLPDGRKAVGSRWVFQLKRDEAGRNVKHKARLVAQGFSQRWGVDYCEVFAPVTRHETLRAMLAVASKNNMHLSHFDVRTAYLHGIVEEGIYMRQAPGYVAAGKEEYVCKLQKSIYGLKQSARCWNRALHAVLVKMGFRQCQSDYCLYTRGYGLDRVLLLVYVDDMLVRCRSPANIAEVYEAVAKVLDVTNLGAVKYFLGFNIRCEKGIYSMQLTSYIEALVKRFGLDDCKTAKTPMEAGYMKADVLGQPFDDTTQYRSLLGAFFYVAVTARPDVAVSVSILGRRVSAPTDMDWKAARRIVKYLKGTKEMRLVFGPGDGWKLTGYSDADWAGDQESRRSTTGFVFLFGSGSIVWTSRKQSCVSLSSMEAEYVALSDACQELIWLRRLMTDLGEKPAGPTTVYDDNQSCLSFVQAERTSKRSKHIDTRRHFIKDQCERGEVNLEYRPSEEMTADALTKPLGETKFRQLLGQFGLVDG